MATVTDSIGLLRSEVEREEALLAKDTKQLQEMEKNAKRAETERRRQMKNVRLVSDESKIWIWTEKLMFSSYRSIPFFDILTIYPSLRTRSPPSLFSQI